MTVGVYGLVAGIVKLDDGGLYLSRRSGESLPDRLSRSAGRMILRLAPYLMKFLSIAGTAAMFLVGGSILLHGIPGTHDLVHHWAEAAGALPGLGWLLRPLTPTLLDAVAGILAGALVLAGVMLSSRAFRTFGKQP
jgi:predicted DNA repair protein MutK